MKNDVQPELLMAFTSHGVDAHMADQVVHVPAGALRVSSHVVLQQADATGEFIVLHVAVHFERLGARPLVESFVGLGSTRTEAVMAAFEKFLKGTFHVLLETLCGPDCDESQGEWASWPSPSNRPWQVCRTFLVTSSDDNGSVMCRQAADFVDRLGATLAADLAPDRIHWFRVFVGACAGEIMGLEVLLDNETWAGGQALAGEWDWVRPSAYTCVRVFAVCLPGSILTKID